MSLDDLDNGDDFDQGLEGGLFLGYLLSRRARRRGRRLPVRFTPAGWGLALALALAGLVGSLGGWGLVACLGWGGAAFTVLCLAYRHAM